MPKTISKATLPTSAQKITRRCLIGGMGAVAAAASVVPAWGDAGRLARSLGSTPARATTTPEGVVLLSRNENAYGPFPSVQQAMRDGLGRANRYPFAPDYSAMIDAAGKLHGVSRNQIVAGEGSTELLRMAADAFTGPGKRLVTGKPTFEAMGAYAGRRGAEVIAVPLTPNYAHDLDAMLAAASANSSGGLIYICNPNNPTGTITPASDLAGFTRRLPPGYVLMIDEAYHHFADGMEGYAAQPVAENLIICRTFSKVYGMAGVRLGYGAMPVSLAQKMGRWQLDNNVNAIAAQCGATALNDTATMQATARKIVGDRGEFVRQAKQRNLAVLPTYTNFAMVEAGRPAPEVIAYFRKNKIEIGRLFPALPTHVRVSFGTPEEMQRFWQVWDGMKTAAAAEFHGAGAIAANLHRWDGSC